MITLVLIVYVATSTYYSVKAYRGYDAGNPWESDWIHEPTIKGALKHGFLDTLFLYIGLMLLVGIVVAAVAVLCGIAAVAIWLIGNTP